MATRTALAALLLTAALATGCDAAAEPAAPSPAPSPAQSSADPAPPTAEPAPTATVTGTPAGTEASGTALLTDVRLAHQEGFDRVTFEFSGALPRYEVRYTDGPVLASGSGEEVEVGGEAVLMVRMEPASGFDMAAATPSYGGPPRLTSDTTNIVEVVRTGDFEAVLEWAVGVRTSSSYEVTTLADPPRVVVDVATD